MKLKKLINQRTEAEQDLNLCKKALFEIDSKINDIINEPVNQIRTLQKKDTGAVSVDIEGITVKHTAPKKVSWNQKELRSVFLKIKDHGDDPEQYMDMAFKIPEKKYGAFDPAIKAVFDVARTVSTGKPKVEFKGV